MSTQNDSIHQLNEQVLGHRSANYATTPLFLNRWSPRAYSSVPVSDEDLNAVLEAASWAPSAFNDQPWRFHVAKTEEHLALFHQFINEFNLNWCSKAPVLIVIASNKLRANGDPNGPHAFDTGAAWGSLALQATIKGLVTHAMGGFDRAKARTLLNVPEHYDLHAVVALGYPGDKQSLPEGLQQRELPSARKALSEIVVEGPSETI